MLYRHSSLNISINWSILYGRCRTKWSLVNGTRLNHYKSICQPALFLVWRALYLPEHMKGVRDYDRGSCRQGIKVSPDSLPVILPTRVTSLPYCFAYRLSICTAALFSIEITSLQLWQLLIMFYNIYNKVWITGSNFELRTGYGMF